MTSPIERLTTALADRYRLDRELGAGGMATVYLAHDIKHERDVAIKVLHPDLGAALGGERFLTEIRTTARLQHPHILPLLDSGEADGLLYYVMPLVTGETLRARLERERQLPIADAVRIAREVASALDYAHRQNVIHRDIKPENILLHDGSALVADFGIALAVQTAGGQRMTQTGLSLGTPQYMSPEQAMGERTIDARSDVYALGAVTYEMLAGDAPFTGSSVQAIVAKVISSEPERLSVVRKTVPPHIEVAVLTALAKLPADRFASAAEFATALSTNSGATYAATSATAGTPAQSPRAQRLTMAALLVTTATAAVALWGWLKPAPPAEVSRHRIVLSDSLATSNLGTIGRTMDIAPDGSAIVFTHGRGETTQLYLKRRDEVTATVIPGTSGQPTAPTFSPDGQWLAYAGGRDRKLYTIPRAGGSPTALADSLRAANTSLAWLETDTVLYVHQDNGLRAVSRNGGPSRVILAADTGGRTVRNVSALPGGRSALFMMCEAGCNGSALLAVDLRTSKPTRLAEDALDAWWLAGGVVAYAARDGQVYAAPFDVKTLSFTRTPVAVLTGVRGTPGNADMVVSASGMALYVPGNGILSVFSDAMPVWVSRSGTATPVDTGWRLGTAFENGRTLALSPDGRQLAVMVLRSGAVVADIWVKQLDRAPFTNTRVTFGGGNANPVWSPDGRSLLFTSGSSGRRGFVFRKPADGTGVVDTVVRLARGLNEVVVTPESTTFLVRLTAPGSRDIVQAQRGRDTAVPLVASPTYQEIGPALSPDGKWLAYASNESGRYEVYVRPYPDVNAGRWQLSQAGGLAPLWSRNGRELFYLDGAGMLVSAAVLPDATFKLGTQTPLFNTNGYASNELSLFYDASPDAQRFLLLRLPVSAATGGKVELVQITNWAAEVRAKLAGAVR